MKTRLPQHGIVKQPLDQDDFLTLPNLLPCIQATLGTGQETMGEGRTDAATVDVNDVLALS